MRLKPLLCTAFLVTAITPSLQALGPTVVPTAEGQIGEVPNPEDRLLGTRFESIRGQAGEVLLGGLTIFGGAVPPPPEFSFVLDALHGASSPGQVGAETATFGQVLDLGPTGSARARNAADDGDVVAFSFARDGTAAGTMEVVVPSFDENGQQLSTITLDDIPTFPDPSLNSTGVTVDDQGRVTVVYTELPVGQPTRVRAARFDAMTALPLGVPFDVTDTFHAATDVALLDPAGNRLVVVSSDFGTIRGNVIDTSGPTVLPEFAISTTPAIFANLAPTVASDPSTGAFVGAWENISGVQGDPVNVYARRFDADGNPIGDDFVVNTTTADAQGQPAAAMATGGAAVIAWASDPLVPGDELDVFARVYDADGNPIGDEVQVNTTTPEVQDRPAVRFLPELDAQGRPQFAVVWRDVGEPQGSGANGSGTSYRCFSIDGLEPPDPEIFADGFESGDTSSWSATQGE